MTQISILAINIIPAQTSKGDSYEQVEVTYKDLSYNNTTKTKKIMPFGSSKQVHTVLKGATNGQVFDVETVKNNAGYIDWLSIKPGVAGQEQSSPQSVQPAQSYTPRQGAVGQQTASAPARTSTYETPEERAKKQVYIIRQSSSSTAVAALSVGAKAPLKVADVVAFARELEAYVFDTGAKQEAKNDTGFDDMTDDIPY